MQHMKVPVQPRLDTAVSATEEVVVLHRSFVCAETPARGVGNREK